MSETFMVAAGVKAAEVSLSRAMNSGSPTSPESSRSSPCGIWEYFTETNPSAWSLRPHETEHSSMTAATAAHRQRNEIETFVFIAGIILILQQI